ncbi:MAG: gephyrin-like molybdotransferase Glp [Microbacteriaceae bacterium]
MPMRRTIAEYRAAVRSLVLTIGARLETEPMPVSDTTMASAGGGYLGRVLAEDVFSNLDLPPFQNSQMDGYAIRSADVRTASQANPVALPVAAPIAAGDPPVALREGEAAPIMTGAPIPAGADAVIPIEAAFPPHFMSSGTDPGSAAALVRFQAPTEAGSYLRARGSDLRAGSLVLAAGTRMGPAQWGVLAACGLTSAPVRRRIRVLVLSSGHELRRSGEELEEGQIYDANGIMLVLALQDCAAETTVEMVPDDQSVVLAALSRSAAAADLIVTTGGVSAGSFEVVRDVFESRGVMFQSIAMQPGGPQGLGEADLRGILPPAGRPASGTTIPVICFPGNPVSTMVSFEMFLRPVLRELTGSMPTRRRVEHRQLADAVDSPPAKHQVRRGRVNPDGQVELVGGPSSHLLHSYASASALVHLPVGVAHAEAGATVEIWRLDE